MTTESNGSARATLTIPYPILTAILAAFMWLAGLTGALVYTLATLNANFANLNQNLTYRDSQTSSEIQKLQGEMDIYKTYVQDLREKTIKLETRLITKEK